MNICPRCNKPYTEHPALSRVYNKTRICALCGTEEALDAAGLPEGSSIRVAIIEASTKWRKQNGKN